MTRDESLSREELGDRLTKLTPEQRAALLSRIRSRRSPRPTKQPEQSERPEGSAPPKRAGAPRSSLFFFAAQGKDSAAEKYDLVLESARFADANDLEAVWVPERHFDAFGGPYPNPAILLAALAAVTRRVQLRAGSVVLPLHDPIGVAEDFAMVDAMSGGRVGISFASGWHPNDFAFAPGTYEQRKAVLADRLTAFQQAWRGDMLDRTNGLGAPVRVRTFPSPVQPMPPLWLTSSSQLATWEHAGRTGLNVLTGLLEQTVDDLAAKVEVYRSTLAAHGHDPESRTVTVMLHTFLGDDLADVRATVHGPLTQYLRSHMALFEKMARSRDLGIDVKRVTDADREALIELGFERYFTSHGLFGTPESAAVMARRLHEAGADELAHLVDFGIEPATVVAHLAHLVELQRRLRRATGRASSSRRGRRSGPDAGKRGSRRATAGGRTASS